jgi:uncharacterized protein YjbI with pentapeptide repeats
MANHKHVEILFQGVDAWNRWREHDGDIFPNLSGSNLNGVNLAHANLRLTDLRKTDLRRANLVGADLFKADLRNANLRGVNAISSDLKGANMSGAHLISADLSRADLQGADMRGVRLDGSHLHEANLKDSNLSDANLSNAHLLSANLMRTNLRGSNLAGAVLVIANLAGADLSMANLTGARLYGTDRDEWKISGIKCDYAFWDGRGNQRTPADRNYKPGEFELLYRQTPTVEYFFDEASSPFHAVLMDRVVKVIHTHSPELEIQLDSMIFSGMPRAVFSVLHRKDRPKALELIDKCYKEQMQRADAMEVRDVMDRWEREARCHRR